MTRFNPKYEFDVFISYSTKDADWVHSELVTRLMEHDIRWIEEEIFQPGKAKLENRVDAVTSSSYTLLILTPSWVKDQWSNFDGLLAREKDLLARSGQTLPLLLIACPLPAYIDQLEPIDFTAEANWEKQFKRLIGVLCGRQGFTYGAFRSAKPARVFSLNQTKWKWIVSQIENTKGESLSEFSPLVYQMESLLLQIVDKPDMPFYETRRWTELRILFDRVSRTSISHDINNIVFQFKVVLRSVVESALSRSSFQKQPHKRLQLLELIAELSPQDWRISAMLKSEQDLCKKHDAQRQAHYKKLLDYEEVGNLTGMSMMLDWFWDNDPCYLDLPKRFEELRRANERQSHR